MIKSRGSRRGTRYESNLNIKIHKHKRMPLIVSKVVVAAAAWIKNIMQVDMDAGKVALPVPVLICYRMVTYFFGMNV
uniref:Uncharacterized protein n=1 Tax=Tanacetum cinerariifolium TaxID=118510 RepID=A0A699J164_TANCI|nr:hypothetical protein [Tanacetum cinerariifolium]